MHPLPLGNPILSQPDATLVCYCAQVTKGQIRAAVADGCRTLAALRKATGCCPKENDCEHNNPRKRCCQPEIKALLLLFSADYERNESRVDKETSAL